MNTQEKIAQLFENFDNVTVIRGDGNLYKKNYWYVLYDGRDWDGSYTGRKSLKFQTYAEAAAYIQFQSLIGIETNGADKTRMELSRFNRIFAINENYGTVSLKAEALN